MSNSNPTGKVTDISKRGLKLGVTSDHKTNTVKILMERPVQWMHLTTKEARQFAKALQDRADELEKKVTLS